MTNQPPTIKSPREHKHDWQLLTYGSKPTYVGTIMKSIVLIVCRECGKVVEKEVEEK